MELFLLDLLADFKGVLNKSNEINVFLFLHLVHKSLVCLPQQLLGFSIRREKIGAIEQQNNWVYVY